MAPEISGKIELINSLLSANAEPDSASDSENSEPDSASDSPYEGGSFPRDGAVHYLNDSSDELDNSCELPPASACQWDEYQNLSDDLSNEWDDCSEWSDDCTSHDSAPFCALATSPEIDAKPCSQDDELADLSIISEDGLLDSWLRRHMDQDPLATDLLLT